jgi:hypothetical protein
VFGSESSNSRLAKFWNWEFTLVNDHLQSKPNEEVGLYGQTLIKFLFKEAYLSGKSDVILKNNLLLLPEIKNGYER